jgi:cation transport protein ChaC
MTTEMKLTKALVDLLPASVPDPGPMADVQAREDDGYHPRMADQLLSEVGEGGEFWVFAFGSLIWKPRFEHAEARLATVDGWHRSFCLGYDERYRGCPDAPGLMLSLDKGGSCEGKVFRLPAAGLRDQVLGLLSDEPPIPPVWVTARTDTGPVQAIAFTTNPNELGYVGGLTDDQVADTLSRAVGMYGSMPDYLRNTVLALAEVGIHDEYLWRIQDLVAAKLAAR